MAATVTISESNGAGETITSSITNSNMGDTDAVNLDPVAYPITAGNRSYEKWQRLCCSAAGGSSSIKTVKVWADAAMAANATLYTNARESSYGGAQTYNTPAKTDRSATYGYTQTMPTSTPTGANLGIGGLLTGTMDITSGLSKYSDYLVMQISTTGSATAGKTLNINWQYDEIA